MVGITRSKVFVFSSSAFLAGSGPFFYFMGLTHQENASDLLSTASTKHSHNQDELIAGTWPPICIVQAACAVGWFWVLLLRPGFLRWNQEVYKSRPILWWKRIGSHAVAQLWKGSPPKKIVPLKSRGGLFKVGHSKSPRGNWKPGKNG